MNKYQVKIQKFGAFLSSMVMPNIGLFIAWGILAALFIPTGWMPNEKLAELIDPTIKYAIPLLIGYTGGFNIYSKRGGVAGVIGTLGIVIGSDITMIIGGMVMGPLSAALIRLFDKSIEGKVKPGLEMLIDNFSIGIFGAILMIVGFLVVEPIFSGILGFISMGVQVVIDHNMLPFASVFVVPAQVLFLNNAVNHGIMAPIGIEQVADQGRSILFLVEGNGGNWFGLVMAFAFFGKGAAKKSAPGVAIIQGLGGIGEVAFPYALIKPWTIIGPIAGSFAALLFLQTLNGGTVGPVSPGSFISLIAMSPKGYVLINAASYLLAAGVSFAIVSAFLIADKSVEDNSEEILKSIDSSNFVERDLPTTEIMSSNLKKITFACDAGMGSSVMGVSILKTKLRKANINIEIDHSAINNIPADVEFIITSKILEERVKDTIRKKYNKEVPMIIIDNLLSHEEYDNVINQLKKMD
ncbi:MAG: PTS transporter subunit EIIC [Coprobacillaceae bacterium]